MINPTGAHKAQIETSVSRLRGNPDIAALVEYLNQRREVWVKALIANADESSFRCAQGHAQEVTDLLHILTRGFTHGNSTQSK